MKTVEELGVPEPANEQIENLCAIADETARRCLCPNVSEIRMETFTTATEAEGSNTERLEVESSIGLSSLITSFDTQKLVDDAVKEVFKSAEEYLRQTACHSQR